MNTMDMFKLDGKTALITGGARNLGYYMALALAEAGADVALTSRSLEQAEEAAKKINTLTGRNIYPCQLDFSATDIESDIITLIKQITARTGTLDILVNNAGNTAGTPENASLEKRPLKLWHQAIELNMTSVFLLSKHVTDLCMMPRKSGNIINIGSTAGMIGKDRRVYEGTGMGGATIDYEAAKGGVINMTRDMAVYLAPYNIRVNTISPCGFLRNQHPKFIAAYSHTIPMDRMGFEDKELKGAVVFLASEASSFVTGHNLVVDGGLTIW